MTIQGTFQALSKHIQDTFQAQSPAVSSQTVPLQDRVRTKRQ